jgi:hypothetical protein
MCAYIEKPRKGARYENHKTIEGTETKGTQESQGEWVTCKEGWNFHGSLGC